MRGRIAVDDVALPPTVAVEALASVLRIAGRSQAGDVVPGRESQLPGAAWVVHVGDAGVVGGCRCAHCNNRICMPRFNM